MMAREPGVRSLRTVTLRDGVEVDWEVVRVVLAIEARGATFHVDYPDLLRPEQAQIRIEPKGVLTTADRAYLTLHKGEVVRILTYQPDDAHLRGSP
jgi:hypothetical protein